MIPKLIDYNSETGQFQLTESVYCLPELKKITDKYKDNALPYIAYIYFMSAPDSPYLNVPEDEKVETVTYDVINTVGDFTPFEPLVAPAIEKLKGLYTSTLMRHYEGLKILMDKFTRYIIENSIIEGRDGNMGELQRILKDAGANMRSFKDIEKQVDEELKARTRGGHETGEY